MTVFYQYKVAIISIFRHFQTTNYAKNQFVQQALMGLFCGVRSYLPAVCLAGDLTLSKGFFTVRHEALCRRHPFGDFGEETPDSTIPIK